MILLADHDVFGATIRFLRELGHEVIPLARRGLSKAKDPEVLTAARGESRVLLTRDRDFGELVFHQEHVAGVIYLRILPSTQQAVHAELKRVLELYTESELLNLFVVVQPGRHRIRRAS